MTDVAHDLAINGQIASATSFTGKKRIRKSFGRIPEAVQMPNLIEVQRASYEQFLQREVRPGQRRDEGVEVDADAVIGEVDAGGDPLRRLFAVMGLYPVGYYDLSVAGVPVHSTAFRPVDEAALVAGACEVEAAAAGDPAAAAMVSRS